MGEKYHQQTQDYYPLLYSHGVDNLRNGKSSLFVPRRDNHYTSKDTQIEIH